MYENVIYQGRTLKEWQELMRNAFTLGELYQMTLEGCDFQKLISH
jgi:hypothetical protein